MIIWRKRDAEWMGTFVRLAGFEHVGINLVADGARCEKQSGIRRSDITYGTNNEFGFDYLRDNMVYDVADRVQRDLAYFADRR